MEVGNENEEFENVPHQLIEIRDQLSRGERPRRVSVKRFLGWFGFHRRGFNKVSIIRDRLKRLKIATDPDFDSVHIDAPISFQMERGTPDSTFLAPVPQPIEVVADAPPIFVGGAVADPTYRIGKLESADLFAAGRELVSVFPNAAIREAVTLMLSNDFSQLPVMTTEREVKGLISWTSLGSRLALQAGGTEVRHFMEPAQTVRDDTYLFSAVGLVVQYGYVLVRASDQRITGIVTTTDLGLQFKQLVACKRSFGTRDTSSNVDVAPANGAGLIVVSGDVSHELAA